MIEATVKSQKALLVQIVRCIQLKRIFEELNPEPKLNFWRLIHGGFLDLPVLDWCKIFGSNAEPTHWKGVVHDIDKFKNDLFSYLEITQAEWVEYWNHMKDYRDELVAHYDLDSDVSTYPSLDLALRSSYFYYDCLTSHVDGCMSDGEERLEVYSLRFYEKAKEIAAKAIEATSDIKETVF